MFKNWFRKNKYKKESTISIQQVFEEGEEIVTIGDSASCYKITRDISDKVSLALEASTIPLWIGQVYMHYWDGITSEDYNNPVWQNQGLYFWLAEESFPNKSLPPDFEKKSKKYFRIIENVSIFRGTAIPWFGMPGGGLKMGFGDSNNPTPIKRINEQGHIEYIEIIELSDKNLEILHDRENYILLANNNIRLENNVFYLEEKFVTLSQAYSIGVVSIAKIK